MDWMYSGKARSVQINVSKNQTIQTIKYQHANNNNNNSSSLIEFIKAEHLPELLTTSKADQVIVVGDRNMKNKTVQLRRKGKLSEKSVRFPLLLLLVDNLI